MTNFKSIFSPSLLIESILLGMALLSAENPPPHCFCCGSVAQLYPTLCDPVDCTHQASLSFTISQCLLKLLSTESVMLSNHLGLCHPLLRLPSIFPSIRVFSNELALCIRWPKYWSFTISPSKEYSGLISFKIDWFDLLAVQGTLKSLLQQCFFTHL